LNERLGADTMCSGDAEKGLSGRHQVGRSGCRLLTTVIGSRLQYLAWIDQVWSMEVVESGERFDARVETIR
jgi:hypothetical protein